MSTHLLEFERKSRPFQSLSNPFFSPPPPPLPPTTARSSHSVKQTRAASKNTKGGGGGGGGKKKREKIFTASCEFPKKERERRQKVDKKKQILPGGFVSLR